MFMSKKMWNEKKELQCLPKTLQPSVILPVCVGYGLMVRTNTRSEMKTSFDNNNAIMPSKEDK